MPWFAVRPTLGAPPLAPLPVRLNVTISDDLAEVLDKMSSEGQTSKSEVLRKALTLFEVAREGKREGKKLALVDREGHVTTEIVGL